jgi:hypothetical protein
MDETFGPRKFEDLLRDDDGQVRSVPDGSRNGHQDGEVCDSTNEFQITKDPTAVDQIADDSERSWLTTLEDTNCHRKRRKSNTDRLITGQGAEKRPREASHTSKDADEGRRRHAFLLYEHRR